MFKKRLSNIPTKCGFDEYADAISNYIDYMSNFEEVLSIYQIGSVGIPGVSDIDLIVFFDDSRDCKGNYSIYNIDDKFHKLLLHDVFVVPYSVSKDVYYVTSIFDSKKVYGREISFRKPTTMDEEISDLCVKLNDIIVFSLLRDFKQVNYIRGFDVKFTIARLNSTKYPLILLQRLYTLRGFNLYVPSEIIEIQIQIANFRRDIFDLTKDEISIIIEKLVEGVSKDFCGFIIKHYFEVMGYSKSLGKLDYRFDYFDWESIDAYIGSNLLMYANSEGRLSRHIQRNIRSDKRGSESLVFAQKSALYRLDLLEKIYSFRLNNNIVYGALWTYEIERKFSFGRILRNLFKYGYKFFYA